ncbi:MAG: glycosyltransferase family 2 protein [Pseudomonadota bacterium]
MKVDFPQTPPWVRDTPFQPKPIIRPMRQGETFQHFLARRGVINTTEAMKISALVKTQDCSPTDILRNTNRITEHHLLRLHAQYLDTRVVNLMIDPPDPQLMRRLGPVACLQKGVLPWRMRNGYTVILTYDPVLFDMARNELKQRFGPIRPALTPKADLTQYIEQDAQEQLVTRAETRVDDAVSCRNLDYKAVNKGVFIAITLALLLIILSPAVAFLVMLCLALTVVVANIGLRLASIVFHFKTQPPVSTANRTPFKKPKVSILLPLFKEREIAVALIQRIGALDYPKELLDIKLVVEDDDDVTQSALRHTMLPPWLTTVIVPKGGVKTKPRALNYALDHCQGTIIGIYDAEDAPDTDQITRVVEHFQTCPPDVVCLQGVLDFYNDQANWLARCFTIEYATWFRIVLPGLQKMGFPLPLGGTTLFFRRTALETLGAWDAHNVTEDADLGVRLARYGYRTEMIPTTTQEEANCHAWPWVKQRSRWLKGYMVTWAVHMRAPLRLWNDLGPWQFFGVQLLFAGGIFTFLFAPVLWSLWFMLLGLPHPLNGALPAWGYWAYGGLLFLSELINIAAGVVATRSPHHKHLSKWVPSLHFYFPLATVASYKALWELMYNPFYWDKTTHGISPMPHIPEPAPMVVIPPHHVSTALRMPDLNAVSQHHRQYLRQRS